MSATMMCRTCGVNPAIGLDLCLSCVSDAMDAVTAESIGEVLGPFIARVDADYAIDLAAENGA